MKRHSVIFHVLYTPKPNITKRKTPTDTTR